MRFLGLSPLGLSPQGLSSKGMAHTHTHRRPPEGTRVGWESSTGGSDNTCLASLVEAKHPSPVEWEGEGEIWVTEVWEEVREEVGISL